MDLTTGGKLNHLWSQKAHISGLMRFFKAYLTVFRNQSIRPLNQYICEF